MVLTSKQIREVVTEAKPGDKLEIVFNSGTGRKGTLDDTTRLAVVHLIRMRYSYIVFCDDDFITLSCVAESRFWDGDHNRKVTVTIQEGFDRNAFADRLHCGIESIKLIKET